MAKIVCTSTGLNQKAVSSVAAVQQVEKYITTIEGVLITNNIREQLLKL